MRFLSEGESLYLQGALSHDSHYTRGERWRRFYSGQQSRPRGPHGIEADQARTHNIRAVGNPDKGRADSFRVERNSGGHPPKMSRFIFAER